jgi:hypothetical protein
MIETPGPQASSAWIAYFEANAEAVAAPDWTAGPQLSAADRFVIARSLAIFQRGEEGSGQTIARFAWRYAERRNDPDYPLALRALFDEEARHAGDLARFMQLAGISRIATEYSDGVFRFLRHHLGLDGALCMLLTAESIACIYYRALYNATASPLLRQLCAQILRDETQHVRFHAQRIALLRAAASPWLAFTRKTVHAAVFAGAVLAVAREHRSVLIAGLGPRRFLDLCRLEWRIVDRMISGVADGNPTRLTRFRPMTHLVTSARSKST